MDLSASQPGCVGWFFGLPRAPCISSVPVGSATFTATWINRSLREGETANVTLPPRDAYFLMIYLEDGLHADIDANGRSTEPRHYGVGAVCLVDLRAGVAIRLHCSLHSLAVVIPKALLSEVEAIRSAGAGRLPGLPRLVCRRGEADPVIASIASVLLSLFERADASSTTMLRHLATAICAHLLHNFSAPPDPVAKAADDGTTFTGPADDDR